MRYLFISTTVAVLLLTACGPTATPKTVPTPPPAMPTLAQMTFDSPRPLPPTAEPTTPVETESSGRKAVFPNTIIVYQREGRFPDSPQQWTIYHTGRIVAGDGTEWQVPATKVKPLFDFVEAPDFWELDNTYAQAGECLDCLVHILTVYREGEIKEVTVAQEPLDAPENLVRILHEMDSLISE